MRNAATSRSVVCSSMEDHNRRATHGLLPSATLAFKTYIACRTQSGVSVDRVGALALAMTAMPAPAVAPVCC